MTLLVLISFILLKIDPQRDIKHLISQLEVVAAANEVQKRLEHSPAGNQVYSAICTPNTVFFRRLHSGVKGSQ